MTYPKLAMISFFSVQTLLKVLEAVDVQYTEKKPANVVWARLKAFVWSFNVLVTYVDKILQSAVSNQKLTVDDFVSPKLPQSRKIFESLLRNLNSLMKNFVATLAQDLPTVSSKFKPTHP